MAAIFNTVTASSGCCHQVSTKTLIFSSAPLSGHTVCV